MKKRPLMCILVMLLTMLCSVTAWADDYQPVKTSALSQYDLNAPFGFGAGITGSDDENPVTVTTLADLQAALSGSDKKTIYVDGTIAFTGRVQIDGVRNKTIYGLPEATLQNPTHTATVDNTGILTLKNSSNIIIRNLTFKGAGAYDIDGNDNLTLQNCSDIWVDHCDFQDGVDGNLDANNGSDNICVSWCRFRYLISPWSGGSGGSNDHRFSNLWGGGDTATGDQGKLNTTFYACWWDNGCRERMPRVRFGQIHILNCLYSSSNANYCVGAGYKSNIYVEKSHFATSGNAWQNCATETKNNINYFNYNITLTGNEGVADAQSRYSSSDEYFTPTYDYEYMPATSVSSEVSTHAGATLMYGAEATSGKLIDFPTSTTGITVNGNTELTTAEGYDVCKFSNGYTGDNAGKNAALTVSGGFKAGDIITIAGFIKNSDTAKYGTVVLFSATNETGSEGITNIKTFANFANLANNETITEQTYTLEADYDRLFLGRSGNTGTNLTIIKVERAADEEESGEETTFKNFSAIVNNQTGTLLTSAEQVQGTDVSFGIAVDDDGNVSRVAVDDATSIATISGTYHSDHGMTNMSVVVPVPGKVLIQIGKCTYASSTITVKNSNNETVLSYTPTDADKVCWKNDHSNILELLYEGDATTLTISGMGYCPFIAVKEYVEPAEFKDFSAIVNNQEGTLLTSAEQVQGTDVSFGIAVDDDGNVSRVAVDDATSIATISGTYHSDHGMTNMSVVVPVPGKVLIQIGKCTYASSTITVKNSNNETVLSYTPTDADKVCWKNDHSNILELLYEGDATTLTISGMGYCPFIAVKEYVEPAEFKDFSAIVNNQEGTLLTSEETQTQGTAVNFGIAVDNSGNTIRVAADDASSIATISGTYHNDHGMTNMSVVVPVPGKVTIQIGTCTYSSSTITVKNSSNETVISYTPTDDDKKCWKNDHSNIIELKYNGPATTLTISGMGYCPFVAVKKVKTALEKSLYRTDFSEWSTFSASTSAAVVVNKVTNFTEEDFTISSFNTALMSVTDTKFEAYTELPHNALQAAKAANPYVTVSALANITKVRFIHGATGSNRGWKLEAKGDGDAEWVTISDSPANPAGWQEVTKDINRNNCQLRFTNLNNNENAYMFELEIFGEVELTMYDITGTISGGNIDGSTITLTGNGETFEADVVDGGFTASVPAGTYTISLSDDVPFLLVSPTEVEVTEAGSIGTITIEAATEQMVSGAITNAPAEAFTLTFTGNGHTETLDCAAGATTFSKALMPDTYVISSNVGTLSTLSVASFKVVKEAVTHNIYFPETVPAATETTILVDNTITTETANNYKSVTNALAAAKAGGISAPVITLTSGQTYREQVVIDIPNVTFTTTGTGKAKITFYYGIGYSYYSLSASGVYDRDRAMTRNSIKMIDPIRWGATVLLRGSANGFKAENIIFENSFNQYYTEEEVADGVVPNGTQSINYDRTLVSGASGYKAADSKAVTERAAAIAFENNPSGCELYNCEFIGSQDTFYSSGSIYVKDCSITGNTDYIFGGGAVVFDNCDLVIGGYSDSKNSAYITANSPSASEAYVFRDCTVKKTDRTYIQANLGRDWGGANANVYYFNLKNEIGNDLSYTWQNMGGGVAAGEANLHIYDFDPTINANYSTTGSTGANINGLVSDAVALSIYAGAVTQLGFTPEHIYDDNVVLDEDSYYNVCRIAASASDNVERTVELTRNIGADKWNTIVLPFDLTEAQVKAAFGNGVKVAALNNNSTADNLSFSTVTSMTANQPYAIKVADAFNSATFDDVTVKHAEEPVQTISGWDFVGTYTKGNVPVDSYFFSSNQLWQAEDATNTIKAFRGWFTYNGSNPARQLTFSVDSETTGIQLNDNVNKNENVNYYDLQGRRVAQPKKGLYIKDNKKVIIK